MNSILNQMLEKYDIKNIQDETNAIKEIIQEIVLCGLSRGEFFDNAAFYGGTALRIFYGIDRFSEDLDFALLKPNENFDLTKYFSYKFSIKIFLWVLKDTTNWQSIIFQTLL